MTKEESDQFCRLLTAAEAMAVIIYMRGRPSKEQLEDFNKSIDRSNNFLVEAGVLCGACKGGGKVESLSFSPRMVVCPECNGHGRKS